MYIQLKPVSYKNEISELQLHLSKEGLKKENLFSLILKNCKKYSEFDLNSYNHIKEKIINSCINDGETLNYLINHLPEEVFLKITKEINQKNEHRLFCSDIFLNSKKEIKQFYSNVSDELKKELISTISNSLIRYMELLLLDYLFVEYKEQKEFVCKIDTLFFNEFHNSEDNKTEMLSVRLSVEESNFSEIFFDNKLILKFLKMNFFNDLFFNIDFLVYSDSKRNIFI